MTVLGARSLHKAYGPQVLLRDVALTISLGDRIGLLGVNGCGKSTLLKVLAGVEPCDSGTVDRRRGARVAYLPQEPELRSEATALDVASEGLVDWRDATVRHAEVTARIEAGAHDAELLEEQAHLSELVLRLGGWSRDHLAREYLTKLGIADAGQLVGTMSGGERRRVALARLLVSEPDLSILDEPTNHLDTETIEWLEQTMVEMKGAILLVTHDRHVLDAIATRIFELERGELCEYRGNYEAFVEQKARAVEHGERVEANRQNLIRRELAWLRRGAQARSTKQKARIQRAEAVIAVEGPKRQGQVRLDASAARTGKSILDLAAVGLEIAGRTLIDELTLNMVAGDRIGVIGPNGAGKTSLLRIVTGDLPASRGEVRRGKQTRLAYFDQARAGLVDEWSVFDNVAEREGAERSGGAMVRMGEREIEVRSFLEQLLFDSGKQRQLVGSLSGGERARVALAKTLKTGANLLLLDEPTNDLDVGTLAALEELLVGWPGCALVVTHDRYFLNRVATSVLAFERSSPRVIQYAGGYDDYRSMRPAPATQRSEPPRAPSRASSMPPAAVPTASGRKPLTYAERIELAGILDVVGAAEGELAAVEARLADPAIYAVAGGAEARALDAERRRLTDQVVELTARWESLEARSAEKGR